jgi:mono/diheme cytochrome c family protein
MLRVFDRGLAVVSWIAAALVVVLLFAGPSLVGADKSTPGAPASPGGQSRTGGKATTGAKTSTGGQSTNAGAAVFASAGCSGCHTLKAAGASGSVGPDLDQVRPTAAAVASIVRSGGGAMPSFSGKLSDAQIAAVAAYVSSVAGR